MVSWHRKTNSRCLIRVDYESIFGNLFDSPSHTPTMAENNSVHDENENQQVHTMSDYL